MAPPPPLPLAPLPPLPLVDLVNRQRRRQRGDLVRHPLVGLGRRQIPLVNRRLRRQRLVSPLRWGRTVNLLPRQRLERQRVPLASLRLLRLLEPLHRQRVVCSVLLLPPQALLEALHLLLRLEQSQLEGVYLEVLQPRHPEDYLVAPPPPHPAVCLEVLLLQLPLEALHLPLPLGPQRLPQLLLVHLLPLHLVPQPLQVHSAPLPLQAGLANPWVNPWANHSKHRQGQW